MFITCPQCKQPISSAGAAPRFCSQCGTSLVGLFDNVAAEKTNTGLSSTSKEELTPTIRHPVPNPINKIGLDFDLQRPANSDDMVTQPFHRDGVYSETQPILPPGSLVGRYRLSQVLGQGGMGTVYHATHEKSGQNVALKLVSKSIRSTAEMIDRFKRESLIAASINHPRSTFVYQSGQHEGQLFITMELMTGGTLSEVIQREGPLSVGRAVDYMIDILSGLQAAHQAGIVHRDLKPSNCFLDEMGRVKIGDFGLSKSFLADSSLTQTGQFMGTPQFAAPEQLRSSNVDERADIYAVGGVLFFLLAGRAPFVGNAAQVIASITTDSPPKLESLVPDVPRELSRIVNQTLEKDPARRPENVDALRQSLLPFSTRGISTPDVGRRMAAFFIDTGVLILIMAFLSTVVSVIAQMSSTTSLHQLFLVNLVLSFVVSIAYFAIQESRWGTTFGKWLMGMRVISDGNHAPSLPASILRAALVPGVSYVASSLPPYLIEFDPLSSNQSISAMILIQFFQLLSWLPNLLCFVTAKKITGFRGWHEIISGTRVVRLGGELEYRRLGLVPVTLPVALHPHQTFGDFSGIGRIGKRLEEGSSVLLGRDISLDRDVWIINHTKPKAEDWWELRKDVSRLTRLRILAEQNDELGHWVVTEAIKGMPLIDYIQQTPNVDWRSFRPLLRELVFELNAAEADGTMPRHLGLRSVWVDHVGRLKLLDEPVARPKLDLEKSDPQITSDHTNLPMDDRLARVWQTPYELVTELLSQFIENQVVPEHVLEFQEELNQTQASSDWMSIAEISLIELADKPSAWRWDDRLGVMAISTGLEFSTASSLVTIAVGLIGYFDIRPTWGLTTAIFFLGSAMAFALGWVSRGGPAFQVSGVLVRRNKTLEPASRTRCGLRMLLAWLPLVMIATCGARIASFGFAPQSNPTEAATSLPTEIAIPMMLIAGLILFFPMAAAYSIWQPSRGIVDVLSGTRLIRK